MNKNKDLLLITSLLPFLAGASTPVLFAQTPTRPPRTFASHCAMCHGSDAGGTDRAPGILPFVGSHPDDEVIALVRTGRMDRGMPKFDFNDAESKAMMTYLHGVASGTVAVVAGAGIGPPRPGNAPGGRGGRGPGLFQPQHATVRLQDGKTLEGTLTSQDPFSGTLLTADGKFHLIARNGETYSERPIDPKRDWTSYNGSDNGNRYSSLEQINTTNVKHLAPAWMFPVPNAPRLEATPVVVDGIMYFTAANEAYALDATTGRQIWVFRIPRTKGILSDAGGGANRGVAISGNRIFMITDNAHLLALDRTTGKKVWDTTMGDIKDGYSATAAPLVIGDLVLSGVAGGEEGARGMINAYKAETGEHVWRFYTIPAPGEKGSETWVGNAILHGCGATWVTGSYDATLGLTYWTVGNPCPDYNGADRKGDNLYTNSVVALDAKTGALKWHFQFTPHDTHDWDSTGPLLLTDQMWQGRERKLVMHADPDGFFFVLDRTNGELLLAAPLGKQDWTTGFGKDGRPILTENAETNAEGTTTACRTGAPKWASAVFEPASKLYITRTSYGCSTIRTDPQQYEVGMRFWGGVVMGGVGEGGQAAVQAVDAMTGTTKWQYPLYSGGNTGFLSTAGGLTFFGEGSGAFTAVDSKSGTPLWHYDSGHTFRSSPMTYMVGGKQYVVLDSDTGGVMCFALVE
jgi:alcohol dehydrogenase (cytochrome c)